MKLTAFLGSPRVGGNTDLLAAEVLRGAAEVGIEAEAVALRELRIRACTGCEKCWTRERPCVFDDDMSRLYELIGRSDLLLFATPVYWYGPTTLMKGMIDRLVPLNRPQGRPLIEGKGVVVVTAYEEEGPEAAAPLLRMFELSCAYLRAPLLDRVVVEGVGPRGAVREKPEALARAYQVGRRLGDWSPEGSAR